MDHDTITSKLYEFYDGELSETEAQTFSNHLTSCQECQSEIELLRKTAQIFFKKLEISVPSDFTENVMNRILEKSRVEQKIRLVSIFNFLNLPKWEVVTVFSMYLLILSYFSIDYLKSPERMQANPVALLYREAGIEPDFLSKKDMGREDLLEIALGDGGLNGSDVEADFHE